MEIFLLKGQDPNDEENPVKTWIVVADRELDARKLLPGNFNPPLCALPAPKISVERTQEEE